MCVLFCVLMCVYRKFYVGTIKQCIWDEQDMRDAVGKARTNSVTFFFGPLHMDVPVLADQQESIYISFVQTQGVVWRTCRERWTIGMDGEKELGKPVQSVWLYNDIYIYIRTLGCILYSLIYIYIYIYIYIPLWVYVCVCVCIRERGGKKLEVNALDFMCDIFNSTSKLLFYNSIVIYVLVMLFEIINEKYKY